MKTRSNIPHYLSFSSNLLWPVVILIFITTFKTEISSLIKRIEKLDIFGLTAELTPEELLKKEVTFITDRHVKPIEMIYKNRLRKNCHILSSLPTLNVKLEESLNENYWPKIEQKYKFIKEAETKLKKDIEHDPLNLRLRSKYRELGLQAEYLLRYSYESESNLRKEFSDKVASAIAYCYK